MRKELTPAELALWCRLRGDQLGVRFRRQHLVGSYIADFFAHAAQLVVEVDGDSHDERREYDEKRTYWMSRRGLSVVRYTNEEVLKNLDAVVQAIADRCSSAARPSPLPSPRSTGEREEGA
jgi:very-short-patch-repair endonuclease